MTNPVLSVIYSLGQISLGLLLHPYQTLQQVVKDQVFQWLIILPSFFLMSLVVLWRVMIVPLVRHFFTCQTTTFLPCRMLPFLAHGVILFAALWQILVLYLWLRFHSLKSDSAHN